MVTTLLNLSRLAFLSYSIPPPFSVQAGLEIDAAIAFEKASGSDYDHDCSKVDLEDSLDVDMLESTSSADFESVVDGIFDSRMEECEVQPDTINEVAYHTSRLRFPARVNWKLLDPIHLPSVKYHSPPRYRRSPLKVKQLSLSLPLHSEPAHILSSTSVKTQKKSRAEANPLPQTVSVASFRDRVSYDAVVGFLKGEPETKQTWRMPSTRLC